MAQSEKVKDTEALVSDLKVPEVNAQVVSRHEELLVTVHRHRVYVVCVSVGVDAPRTSFDHQIHGLVNWHLGNK